MGISPKVLEQVGGPESWSDIRNAIENALSYVPHDLLAGLDAVVVRDQESFSRAERRRKLRSQGRKRLLVEMLGIYYPKHDEGPAYIEINVSNIFSTRPRFFRRLPVLRDAILSRTLFHEIGHHVESTLGSPGRDEEVAAQNWELKLSRRFFRRKYWYLTPLLPLFRAMLLVLKVLQRVYRSGS